MSQEIRNVAIIAHVDHGKTTLVDEMMKYCQLFREGQEMETCFLDNNDQERERGITILAKNIALDYKGTKINLIDTPGHADFSGEVERVLKLADGCVLLVDAHDGVMPQTKFVLRKALAVGLKPIVVVNKMDRPDGRPKEALETVYDLFLDLDVDEDALEFPIVYASGRSGWASDKIDEEGTDLEPLMETIIKTVPAPQFAEGPVQMQVTSFEFSDYVGRIGVGRVYRGTLKKNAPIKLIKNSDGSESSASIKTIYVFEGLGKKEVDEVKAGDLCAVVGIEGVEIGDTIADAEQPEALPKIEMEEPTISMSFTVNDSPFYGQEGKYVTSRHLSDYLEKALERDVSLRVEPSDTDQSYKVFGRGVLHLSVLVENMRRADYELAVGQPQVVYKEIDGSIHEPFELLVIEVGEEHAGKVIEQLAMRKGDLQGIEYTADGQVQTFHAPSRGIIGLRSFLLNACGGNVIMNHRFLDYRPKKGNIDKRQNGVILSMDEGQVVPYAIANLQDRGVFFVSPGGVTYKGQIIGEHCKAGDIEVNIQKEKKLSNMRASGSDKALKFAPAREFTLEEALEFIGEDELVEATPTSIRMRKKILDANERKRAAKHLAG
jgi:GTP-binding protein